MTADPRLAELTEVLRRLHDDDPGIFDEIALHDDAAPAIAAAILARWPARTATAEAELTEPLRGIAIRHKAGYQGYPLWQQDADMDTLLALLPARTEAEARVFCVACGFSVLPENHPNHLLGKAHQRKAAVLTRTATTEAVALAADLASALERCKAHLVPSMTNIRAIKAADEVLARYAAALAATGGEWTEPQSLMPAEGGKA